MNFGKEGCQPRRSQTYSKTVKASGEGMDFAFGSAHFEVRAIGRVPLVFDGSDFVGLVVQLESKKPKRNAQLLVKPLLIAYRTGSIRLFL
jgi:hypothetical protein